MRRSAAPAVLLAVCLAGCSSTGTSVTQQREPLLGDRTPPNSIAPPTPHTATGPANVTPVPQSFNPGPSNEVPASSNPATLAGSNWQPPQGRPLALNDNNSTGPGFLPGQLTSTSRTAQDGYLPPNPNPKVEPVPDTNPAPKVAPASNWGNPQPEPPAVKPVNATAPANTDGLAEQLKSRGVVDQNVETTAKGLHLTCYVRSGPTGRLRIVEAVDAPDYPTAARAILKQLESPP
jgi:hypothetical protein